MLRTSLTVILVLGLAGFGRAQYGAYGGLKLGTARMDADGQVYLRLPSGSPPQDMPVTVKRGDREESVMVRRTFSSEIGLQLDGKYVEAVDTDGKPIEPAELAKLLAKETPAILFDGGSKPDAGQLKLFRKGTPVLLLPVSLYGWHYGAPPGGAAVPAVTLPLAPQPIREPVKTDKPAPEPIKVKEPKKDD